MMRRHHAPAPAFGLDEHMHEVRVRNSEECGDTLRLEQLQNPLINGRANGYDHFQMLLAILDLKITPCESLSMGSWRAEQTATKRRAFEVGVDTALPGVTDAAV